MLKKIKIAFIKFGGLAAGGTERALQTIAANLPKDEFEIDYFYCDAAPYIGSDYKHDDTDPARKAYMQESGINLIKFDVQYKNLTTPTHDWVNTNFWTLFDESKYDIIQTARAGHSEYPFTQINDTPQVDLITLPGMAERKNNVYKTVHISQFQADTWVRAGGDPNRVEIIPLFGERLLPTGTNLKKELSIEDKFVFGMHQRDNDGIFSPVPLMAYKNVETDNTAFLLLGGSKKYSEQAKELQLKNFIQLPHCGESEYIAKFLQSLNVYAHGRADGETFSLAIAEAMSFGLPIISHLAPAVGHAETMGNAGVMANSMQEYVYEMHKLIVDMDYYGTLSANAINRFTKHLSLEANTERWVKLYKACIADKNANNVSDEEFWDNMWS